MSKTKKDVDANKDGGNPLSRFDRFHHLPQDMYGASVFVIIEDFTDFMFIKTNRMRIARMALCLSMMIMNLALQLQILNWVNIYIVDKAVHNSQVDYKQYHREVYDDSGSFIDKAWHAWTGPRGGLCSSALSATVFTSAITFIWLCRMSGELKETLQLIIEICILPASEGSTSKDMVLEVAGSRYIVALALLTRILIVLLVCIPKIGVCVVLSYVGTRWIAATTSYADLVLNSLALEFVIGIDELIYANFAPSYFSTNLGATMFAHPKAGELASGEQRVNEDKHQVRYYGCALIAFVTTIVVTFMYLNYWQQVLPGYKFDIREHCDLLLQEAYTPICGLFGKNCFPYGPKWLGSSIQTFYTDAGCKDEIGMTKNWTIDEDKCYMTKMSTQNSIRYRKFECDIVDAMGNKTITMKEYTERCEGTPVVYDVSDVWPRLHSGQCYFFGEMYSMFKGGLPSNFLPTCKPRSVNALIAGQLPAQTVVPTQTAVSNQTVVANLTAVTYPTDVT